MHKTISWQSYYLVFMKTMQLCSNAQTQWVSKRVYYNENQGINNTKNIWPGGISQTHIYEPRNLRALNFQYDIKIISFNVWVRYVVGNFKCVLWNSTHNSSCIHWKICILLRNEDLRAPRHTSLLAFFKSLLNKFNCVIIAVQRTRKTFVA